MILLDTNVLGRMTDASDPHHVSARTATVTLLRAGEQLVIVPQNCYEFWAVATRKPGAPPGGQNGLGMTSTQASHWLRFFQRRFTLLPDRTELIDRWHALVLAHDVKGFHSHDARLVAAMQTYGITRILTFNAADFRAWGVTVLDPSSYSTA